VRDGWTSGNGARKQTRDSGERVHADGRIERQKGGRR
jgi:hypothetical protein